MVLFIKIWKNLPSLAALVLPLIIECCDVITLHFIKPVEPFVSIYDEQEEQNLEKQIKNYLRNGLLCSYVPESDPQHIYLTHIVHYMQSGIGFKPFSVNADQSIFILSALSLTAYGTCPS